MRFYKIINEENFVGIGTSFDFRCFQLKHQIVLTCQENDAQYIQYKDDLYRALWMVPVNNDIVPYAPASVIEISEDEYDALQQMIEADEVIPAYPEPEIEEVIVDEPKNDVTIDYAKNVKIKELKNKCHQTIIEGFDIVLSDMQSHHFDLTIEDQLNLLEIEMLINKGAQDIPYHASDEICRFYNADDMRLVIDAASKLRKYHTTYFNSLKRYVNSLTTIEDVAAIKYGGQIPTEFMSDILKIVTNEY